MLIISITKLWTRSPISYFFFFSLRCRANSSNYYYYWIAKHQTRVCTTRAKQFFIYFRKEERKVLTQRQEVKENKCTIFNRIGCSWTVEIEIFARAEKCERTYSSPQRAHTWQTVGRLVFMWIKVHMWTCEIYQTKWKIRPQWMQKIAKSTQPFILTCFYRRAERNKCTQNYPIVDEIHFYFFFVFGVENRVEQPPTGNEARSADLILLSRSHNTLTLNGERTRTSHLQWTHSRKINRFNWWGRALFSWRYSVAHCLPR